MKGALNSLMESLRSSKRTILLIAIAVVITLIVSSAISIWLSRFSNLVIPSVGRITALGVEAYWDRNLENKTETFDWGTVYPGVSNNVTLYLRSISNIETTLYLNTTEWNPANISNYMTLSWNYNETTIQPGETIEVTLTLSASSSPSFFLYLITNEVEQFGLDIIIATSEY